MRNSLLRISKTAPVLLLAILFVSLPPAAGGVVPEGKVTVIKAGHILPISRPEIRNGVVFITDGKITAVGRDLEIPEDATILDFPEGWVTPGLIEAHTSFAMGDRYLRVEPDEISNPNTAHLNILDGINPFAKIILYMARGGVTSSMVTPGRRNVIGGQTAVIKHRGNTVDEMAMLSPAGLKFSLGEGPKETYGSKGRLPSTRMGSAYVVRKALIEAGEYLARKKSPAAKAKAKDKAKEADPGKRDLNLEALAAVLEGRLTAFFECYRADDIMTALRLTDEFKLKTVLVGVTEGYKLADEIARRKIPVILSPIGVGPRQMETQEACYLNAGRLDRAGVKVVVKADEALGVGQLRELALMAAFAVKGGMEREKALRAVTLTAAEVLGVADRIGSLEPGKDADIVIFDGDPLHYKTRVKKVLIDGQDRVGPS
jgi:imidazolonepropionase-like amidohydrolase